MWPYIGRDGVRIRLVSNCSCPILRECGVVGTQKRVRRRDRNTDAHNIPSRGDHLRRDVVPSQPIGDSLNTLLRRRYEGFNLDISSAPPLTNA